ncbi:calcium-binding protein [Sagittula sp. S175]|uniref:calcium-binding protein n=1 Tax=Sagittula sp. S175 TaxID=3415129 RepID=UPI003C7B7A22
MLTALIASLLGAMTMAAIAQPSEDPATDNEPDVPLKQPDDHDGMSFQAGEWSDLVTGETSDDWLAGGRSCDTIEGQEGDDTLYGERGRDLLEGGAGDDLLDGGAWHDALDGGEGDDLLIGGTGMDTLVGGEGDDTLSGGEWDDLLIGGAGSDSLSGDGGDDLLYGHTAGLPGSEDMTARAFHESLEEVYDNAEAFEALTESARQIAAEALFNTMVERYPGAVPGADGADTLDGGAGDDTLYGGAGDLLIGGDGNDDFHVAEWTADPESYGTMIDDFGAGDDDLVVEYDASTGALPPTIDVITFQNGDQQVLADGLTVATLYAPLVQLTAADVLVVGLMA